MLRERAAPASRLTLGAHLAAWLDTMRPPRVRDTTWVQYQTACRHMQPMHATPLARLTPNDVRLHVRRMLDAGSAPGTVRHNLTVLRMALGAAVRDRLIPYNVAQDVEPPKLERAERVILTPDEMRLLIEDGEPLWVLLITTGLRIGEALGLRWQDVRPDSVTVAGGMRRVPKELRPKDGKTLERGPVKTDAGYRTVALPVPLRLERPDIMPIDGRVFPRSPRNVERDWVATKARLGIDARVTIHGLRHTAISYALAGGASLDDVKRMAGHSSIRITSDLYGHLVEGRREATGRAIVDAVESNP